MNIATSHSRSSSARRSAARSALALGAILAAVSSGIIATPRPAAAGFVEAEQILNNGTLGGTRGLRVRRIGAAAAFSKNADFVYYPASSMKVIEHLYAMTLVQAGTWSLNGTSSWVCTDDNNCSSLLNTSVAATCVPALQAMTNVLSTMMMNSSNAATNSVQERIGTTFWPLSPPFIYNMPGLGRSLLNDFIDDELNMGSSEVNHKLGCGGPCSNGDPNALTLRDIERLYRAIATDAALLTPANRLQLHDLMLNESNFFLDTIIDQEAAATGKNQWKQAFRDKIFKIYKDGSYTCSDTKWASSSGLLQLPTYNGAYKRLYTWGVFTDDGEDWAYLPGTVREATKELLRPAIRAALLTWGFGYAAATQTEDSAGEIWQLPAANSPGKEGEELRDAAGALQQAAAVLNEDEKDYPLALSLVATAVGKLENARATAPGSVPESLLQQIVATAHEASLDAVAFAVMTADGTILETRLAVAEREIGNASEARGLGAFGEAMNHYLGAATETGDLIEWASRGPALEDEAEGFFGEPAGVVFHDGFELGNPSAWSTSTN